MNPVFSFITDFGYDFAVASMEALVVKNIPQARIIHLDHTIEKFSILSAAFVLKNTYTYFPKGTIFIAIVDPGVGSSRQTLCIETEEYTFIGPNNGIFHYIFKQLPIKNIYHLDETIIQPSSNTFHGRDLFTPAAIKYAQGERNFLTLVKDRADVVALDVLEQQDPIISYIDSFGNIKTTISYDKQFNNVDTITLHHGGTSYRIPLVKMFSAVPVGLLIAYKGSNNTLEIAVNNGSAQKQLRAKAGQQLLVSL